MSAEKSVLVGMSGGIDSTAVCHMLLSQGYRVVGLTFITCDVGESAAQSARELAGRLGIEHHIADVRAEFRRQVKPPSSKATSKALPPTRASTVTLPLNSVCCRSGRTSSAVSI